MIPLPTSILSNLLLSRLPSSAHGPAQLLKPTLQSWFLSFGLTLTSNPTSPNSSSVSKLYPKSIHFSHSPLPPPCSRPHLLAWPDCGASRPACALASLPFHIELNKILQNYKSDPAVPIFHPPTPRNSFPRPTKPSGSQFSGSPSNSTSPNLCSGLLFTLGTCQSSSRLRAWALRSVTISPNVLAQMAPSQHSGLSLNIIFSKRPSLSSNFFSLQHLTLWWKIALRLFIF